MLDIDTGQEACCCGGDENEHSISQILDDLIFKERCVHRALVSDGPHSKQEEEQ